MHRLLTIISAFIRIGYQKMLSAIRSTFMHIFTLLLIRTSISSPVPSISVSLLKCFDQSGLKGDYSFLIQVEMNLKQSVLYSVRMRFYTFLEAKAAMLRIGPHPIYIPHWQLGIIQKAYFSQAWKISSSPSELPLGFLYHCQIYAAGSNMRVQLFIMQLLRLNRSWSLMQQQRSLNAFLIDLIKREQIQYNK